MAGYIGTKAAVVTPGAERKKVFSITTTTSSLTGLAYTPGFVHVFHNGVRLVDGTDYTATNGTSLTLTTAAQNGDEVVVISYATFQTSDTVSASAGGTFSNAVTVNGNLTVDTNTLFVDAANNRVGVGSSSPATRLDVAQVSRYTFDLANSYTLQTSLNAAGSAFADDFKNAAQHIWQTSGAERMRIDASGNLLVGRTSNNSYSGNVHATGFSSVGTAQFNIVSPSASTPFEWVMRTGNEMQFYVNNASVLATLSSSGVWTNASDARYKENIRPITYGIAEVMQLQPRAYNIIGFDKEEIGFVAQEVEVLLPELVESVRNSVTNEDRLTLSYGQLSAVLVKAIQDQQAIIEALEARIVSLEGGAA